MNQKAVKLLGQSTVVSSIIRATLIGLPFALLGVLQTAQTLAVLKQSEKGTAATRIAGSLESAGLLRLPNGWKIISVERVERARNDPNGQFSVVYRIQHTPTSTIVQVSLDYPFMLGWHHLTECYIASGWSCASEKIATQTGNTKWPYVMSTLTNVENEQATLHFCLFDEDGNEIIPPQHRLATHWWRRLFKNDFIDSFNASATTYFQVQLFAAKNREKQVDEETLLQLFETIRETMRKKIGSLNEVDK